MESKMFSNRAIIILIIIFNVIVYFNGLNNEFIWDGNELIKDNQYIKDIENLPKLLAMEDAVPNSINTGFFRPLISVTFMLDYQIFKGEPYGYRITNIAFHTASAIVLFLLVLLMTEKRLLAIIAAAIFSAQAVHAEAVTVLIGRNNVICAFFILLSLYYYVKNSKQGKTSHFIYSMIFLFLGAASKEFAFLLPALFILYDYTFGAASPIKKNIGKYAISFFVLFIFMVYKSFVVPLSGSVGFSVDTLYQRIISTFPIMVKYIVAQIVPYNFYHYYDAPMNESFFEFGVIASFLFLLALISVVFWYRKKEKILFFSLGTYFILLAPVANIFTLPNLPIAMMADRWLYPASAAFAIFLARLIILIFKGKEKYALVATTLFVVLLSSYLVRRNHIYRTNLSALQKMAEMTPGSSVIRNALGLEQLKNGNQLEAGRQYRLAIEANPQFYQPYTNLGNLYILQKRYVEAIELLKTADRLRPNFAFTLSSLGYCYQLMGNIPESNRYYEQATSLNVGLYAYSALTKNYLAENRISDALKLLERAYSLRLSKTERADLLQNIVKLKQMLR